MSECEQAACRIGDVIFLEGERDQKISSHPNIPSEFFEDMESAWKGRVKRIHLEEAFIEVEKAAELLAVAVSLRDFIFLMICRYCFCTQEYVSLTFHADSECSCGSLLLCFVV